MKPTNIKTPISYYGGKQKLASTIDGKFILSSYPSDILQQYAKANGWHMWSIEQGVSVNSKAGSLKRKVEVLTANYPLVHG